jgi:hypothetical protein
MSIGLEQVLKVIHFHRQPNPAVGFLHKIVDTLRVITVLPQLLKNRRLPYPVQLINRAAFLYLMNVFRLC